MWIQLHAHARHTAGLSCIPPLPVGPFPEQHQNLDVFLRKYRWTPALWKYSSGNTLGRPRSMATLASVSEQHLFPVKQDVVTSAERMISQDQLLEV